MWALLISFQPTDEIRGGRFSNCRLGRSIGLRLLLPLGSGFSFTCISRGICCSCIRGSFRKRAAAEVNPTPRGEQERAGAATPTHQHGIGHSDCALAIRAYFKLQTPTVFHRNEVSSRRHAVCYRARHPQAAAAAAAAAAASDHNNKRFDGGDGRKIDEEDGGDHTLRRKQKKAEGQNSSSTR